jgi:predicted permease
MSAWSRFVNLWRPKALDRELDDEVQFHLEMQTERNLARGMERGEAERDARRRFGSRLRATEGMREARTMVWLESLAGDLRYGARLLRRRTGLAVLAIATLSLGIGANAAMFSLLNAILLRPLPYERSDRLVAIVDRFTRLGVNAAAPTIPEILDMRERARAFSSIAFFDTRDFRIAGGDEPTRVFTARVSASLFPTLGVRPALGRLFVDSDNTDGRWTVVVLSDGLWRRNFGGDPRVVGRKLTVNGSPHTIVGVLPPGFSVDYPSISSGEPIEMYVPFTLYELYTSRTAEFVNVRRVTTIGRLAEGATREQASAELQAISQGLAAEHPDLYRRRGEDVGFRMDVIGLQDVVTRGARGALTFLFVAVLLVLLIACVNTGQFVLAQSLDREAEVAVRVSLGAGRGRLFRQFVVESLLLAFAGAGVGLLQALWLLPALVAVVPGHRPELDAIHIDRTVLAFTAAMSLSSAFIVGVLPAAYFSRGNARDRLATRSGPVGAHRARHVLVALEVAVAVVLIVAAGVLIESVRQLHMVDRGLSIDDVTVMQVRGKGTQATRPIASTEYQHYIDHLSAMRGVEAAAAAFPLPLRNPPGSEFSVVGRTPEPADSPRLLAAYQIVSLDYFRAFRIPLRDGRLMNAGDVLDRPRVALINETMARRQWPGESPLGRQIRVGPNTLTVVGVVGDVQGMPLEAARGAQIYVSHLQFYEPNMNIIVRAAPGVRIPPEAIKKAIWSVSPDQAVFNIQPMSELLRAALGEQRYVALLLGIFAALALFMSATGVYTVVAHLVGRRTHEIAVRLAIGAQALDIVRVVSGQTFAWTIAGLAVGVVATILLSGVARAALRGVGDVDARLLAALAVCYLAVAGIAMCLPIARTLRLLDPAAALRAE